MAEKTIEEMQAELEASGYSFKAHFMGTVYYSIQQSGINSLSSLYELDTAVKVAYAHLQAQRELAALRAFVKEIKNTLTAEISNVHGWATLHSFVLRAYDLLKQFNHEDDST